ncbi:pilin [Saccharopolyspora cebuensis]
MRTTPHRHRSRRVRRAACLVIVMLCAGLAVAHGASAETTHVVAVASLDQVLTNIRNWIMGMLALVATVFLTIGGVRYLLANGDPGEVEKAKSAFRNAAFGYMLAALAPVIVDILRGLVGV